MSKGPGHELLQDSPDARACLLGNLAIVRGALEAGIQFFSCYPGTPSPEIGDTFSQIRGEAGVLFEYSINEKVAVEVAFAASLTGARTMCAMKHLGLSYANDPLSTMPYVGVEGGMIIVSAGDPSAITSPNEQDQRHFTSFLYLPVFDPATPDDALRMTRYAFAFSEQTRLPVIMRPTTRVCHSTGNVELGPLSTTRNNVTFTKNPQRYVPIPINARRMRKELILRYQKAEDLLATSDFFPRTGSGKHGVIASGVAYAHTAQVVEELGLESKVSLLQIGAYPIPETILGRFLDEVDSVLVLEELTPFVEDCVSLAAFRRRRDIPVFGKHSKHLPVEFEYSIDLVEDALRSYLKLETRKTVALDVPDLPPRPPVLCSGCPHRASFYIVGKVFGKKTVYCNDIGCYTLGYGDPLHACDVLLCMGSSISQASGISRMTGERVVAFIGDSTFFHSGLPALINAVEAKDNITVVVLDNYITAMTGFQPSVTTNGQGIKTTAGQESGTADQKVPRCTIESAVRGLGIENVHSVDPYDQESALDAVKQAKSGEGVNVVIFHAPCKVMEQRRRRGAGNVPFAIDLAICNACSLCVRILGCPSIQASEEGYTIDPDLCDGCGICATVCKHGAIRQIVLESV